MIRRAVLAGVAIIVVSAALAAQTSAVPPPSEDQFVTAAITLAGVACNGFVAASNGSSGQCPNDLAPDDARALARSYNLLKGHVASRSARAKLQDADQYFAALKRDNPAIFEQPTAKGGPNDVEFKNQGRRDGLGQGAAK